MMKGDHGFNVNFVKMIEEHDVLYNPFTEHYNNREMQNEAWLAIAQESNESVQTCKERWVNLRASFCRHLRNQKNGSAQGRKPYYLAEHMQFLIPFTRSQPIQDEEDSFSRHSPRPTMLDSNEFDFSQPVQRYPADLEIQAIEGSAPWNSSFGKQSSTSRLYEKTSPPPSIVQKIEDDKQLVFNNKVSQSRGNKKRKHTQEFPDNGSYSFQANSNTFTLTNEDDADVSFLKSLLPDMKKMSDRQKCRCKRLMLGVVDDVLYGSMDPTTSKPSTASSSQEKFLQSTPLSYGSNSE
ncbi:uncharacterized protein LOC100185780 [Ciona intestinalis]